MKELGLSVSTFSRDPLYKTDQLGLMGGEKWGFCEASPAQSSLAVVVVVASQPGEQSLRSDPIFSPCSSYDAPFLAAVACQCRDHLSASLPSPRLLWIATSSPPPPPPSPLCGMLSAGQCCTVTLLLSSGLALQLARHPRLFLSVLYYFTCWVVGGSVSEVFSDTGSGLDVGEGI